MIAVIGGPPSCGSSLLVRMLNRHSKILAGPETSLMARPELIADWMGKRRRLLHRTIRKLRNPGWHRYYGMSWDSDFYGLSEVQLKERIMASESFTRFLSDLANELLSVHQKTLWVEKTPANVYGFKALAKALPDVQPILMTRDPRDTIASMVDRGYTPFYATSRYLLNLSFGLDLASSDRFILRYEDLVRGPVESLSNLLSLFDMDFEEGMLMGENAGVRMPGWTLDETAAPSIQAIGHFDRLEPGLQEDILCHMSHLKVNPDFRIGSQGPSLLSYHDLCVRFGYTMPVSPSTSCVGTIKRSIQYEKWIRTFGRYPTHAWNFPVYI